MKRIITLLMMAMCLSVNIVYADKHYLHQDKILVSNIPLAGIVQMITGDVFEIESIDTQNSCPHHYHAKPSDLIKLRNAKIAIYIDDNFETFFTKILKKFPGEVLKITDMVEIGDMCDCLTEAHHNDHNPNKKHSHSNLSSYHIWIDLDFISKVLPKIRDYFLEKYPDYSAVFEQNYQISLDKINQLHKQKSDLLRKMPKLVVISHNINKFLTPTNDLEVIYLPALDHPSLRVIQKLDEFMSSKDDLCIVTDILRVGRDSKDNKIHSLKLKYQKPVAELNTEKWSIKDNIGYSDNFFKQYENLLIELSKCSENVN